MNKYGPEAKQTIEKTMHDYKQGKLKSSHGDMVKSREQAVAIGISEARDKGYKIPKQNKQGED